MKTEGEERGMEEAKGSKQLEREERIKAWKEMTKEEQLPCHCL